MNRERAAVVVAHPDDETLWCGGYMLAHPEFDWRVVTLCRASDPDRAPKFCRVLEELGAVGEMADLDDEPDQAPLPIELVQETIAGLLAGNSHSLILTHGPRGEYTRHLRHEECCRSVVELWRSGTIDTKHLWLFAYEDGGRRLITDVYGYGIDSWEARTTPREEGFWCFDSAQAAATRTSIREQQS
jgi:LmbE family N-acetylglucosaminyl deacetylase